MMTRHIERRALAVSAACALLLGATALVAAPPEVRPVGPGDLRPLPGSGERSDTLWFGAFQILGVDNQYFAQTSSAKWAVAWTFDRSIGPFGDFPRIDGAEGWAYTERSTNLAVNGQGIDASLDLGGPPAPVIQGTGSLWIGADKLESDASCWPCGAGYGNGWRQRVITAPLEYNGAGSVSLSFLYFNDSEPCYDGTQVYLVRGDGTRLLLNPYTPPGTCPANPAWAGGFTGVIGSPNAPAFFQRTLLPHEIGPPQHIRFAWEFHSDPLASDEDCSYTTLQGPFGMDNVLIQGGGIAESYQFEPGAVASFGFTAQPEDPDCDPALPVDLSCYIGPPGPCSLSGNVLEMHRGDCISGDHPPGQHFYLESPVCNLGVVPHEKLFLDLDVMADLPLEDGVFLRVGWKYYPYTCPTTNQIGWSDRVGSSSFTSFPNGLECARMRSLATGSGVPTNAQQVIAIVELWADCNAFDLPSCSGVSNFTPLIDNLAVGMIGGSAPTTTPGSDWVMRGDVLLPSTPNPFNRETKLRYQVAQAGPARLAIYDASGREVRRLVDDVVAPGTHAVQWDGTDESGVRVASGAYWAHLSVGDSEAGRRLLVIH